MLELSQWFDGAAEVLWEWQSDNTTIPLYKADLLKVIAQLISAVKYCIYI